MIPKIIHYCWFGKQPKPEIVLKCIESWKKYCPDWEIIEWNEENFDVLQHPYMKKAYERRKWAFVSDIARLLIVYRWGEYTWIQMSNCAGHWMKKFQI